MCKNKKFFTGTVIFSNEWHRETWLFKKDNNNIAFAPLFKRWIFQSGDRFNDYAPYSKLWGSIKEHYESIKMHLLLNYTKHNEEVEIDNDLNIIINADVNIGFYQKILFKYDDIEEIWFYHIHYSNIWFVDILEPFNDLNNMMVSSSMELLVNEIYFNILKSIKDSYEINDCSDFSEGIKRLDKNSEKQFSTKYDNGIIMVLNPK